MVHNKNIQNPLRFFDFLLSIKIVILMKDKIEIFLYCKVYRSSA